MAISPYFSRETGQFPVSIATSLALEGAAGIYPERPESPSPLKKNNYEEIWFNLRTLFRNIVGASASENFNITEARALTEVMLEEIDTLHTIVSDLQGSQLKPVFYISDYAGMASKYPKAVVRADTTSRQLEFTAVLKKLIPEVLKAYKETDDPIRTFTLKLKPERRVKALIVTNFAYDLCSAKEFRQLDLLESHTGHVKTQALWYTKYQNGKELIRIPFREDFLQVFGDSESFRPMDIKLRKDLIEIAEKYNWSAATTSEKIKYGIAQIKNPFAKAILKEIMV